MEIERCECGHRALGYHGVERHLMILPDGKQAYSDCCMIPGCRCERARIKETASPMLDKAAQKEKHRWARVVAEALS